MNKKNRSLLLAGIAAALLIGVVAAALIADHHKQKELQAHLATADPFIPPTTQTPPSTEPTKPQGSKAPDFTVTDDQGRRFGVDTFYGKPTVINFWASWNEDSVEDLADFQRVYDRYGDRIHLLMVAVVDGEKETVESAKACLAKYNYTFPVYFDTDGSATTAYKVTTPPATFFLRADGQAAAYARGAVNQEALDRGFATIIEQTANDP